MKWQAIAHLFIMASVLLIPFPDSSVAHESGGPRYLITLKSRQFVPSPGMEPDLAQELTGTGEGRRHVLLQFEDIPSEAQRAALEAAGAQLLDYVPHQAWFASWPVGLNPQEMAGGQVRWMGRIEPADRIAPILRSRGVRPGLIDEQGQTKLDVRFFADVSADEAMHILSAHGAAVEAELPDFHRFVIRTDPGAIDSLAQEDSIQWITEAAPPKTTHNDGSRARTHVDLVQSAPYNLSGSGVDLGIWDGGRVYNHLDFSGRLTIAEPSAPTGDHATHVAGTMAGDGANSASQGGTPLQWKGMAPGAGIVSYYWDNNLTDHNGAINTLGIELSQNSWGYTVGEWWPGNCYLYGDYDYDAPAYDDIVTGLYGRRIPVVFAAGNERDDGDCGMSSTPPYLNYANVAPPATAKNILSIGATNSNNDSMTSFSSWGPTDDGRIKPDVAAPGCESSGEGYIHSTLPGNTYGGPGWCGTSMAAPVTSGIIGLVIEQYRASFGDDPLPSTLKALLIQTTLDLDDGTSYYNPGPDYASGYGRVDAQAAVDEVIAGHAHEDQVSHSQTDTYTITVPTGTPILKITLAWDDEPGAVNASPALVNNLDLVLVEPNGTTLHRPWVLDPANPSNDAATGIDSVNNVEQVQVDNPTPGTWLVQVIGTAVPVGPQPYSLAGHTFAPSGVGNVGPLVYNGHVIDDDDQDNSSGNSDGIVNPGETIEMYVEILNSGSDEATDVHVTISTSSPYVTFPLNTSSGYGNIAGGGTAINADDFDFELDPGTPDGHMIHFDLDITASNGGPWTEVLDVPVVGSPAPQAQWTFLVYLDGDNNLEGAGIEDFLEMSSIGSTDDVHILVQFDRVPGYDISHGNWTSAKRFHVTQGMTPIAGNALQDIGEANMGDPQTLIDFVQWGMTNYPADRYAIVLWDHGSGWRLRPDETPPFKDIAYDETNGGDAIEMPELLSALDTLSNGGSEPLDLVGFDACLMGMIEVDNQVIPHVDVRVGSEEVEPWAGWRYDTVLSDLVSSPLMLPSELGTLIVERYFASYGDDHTMSAVDLRSPYGTLNAAVDDFASALINGDSSHHAEIAVARTQTQEFHNITYIDLFDFAYQVNQEVADAAINAAATAVMNAVDDAVIRERHGAGWPGAHGISIYFPESQTSYDIRYDGDMDWLQFTAGTQWDDWLHAFYASGGTCADPNEPNDTPGQATPIGYTATLADPDICPAGDKDYYSFAGTAGDSIVADVDAQAIGSFLDPYLYLYDTDGVTELAHNDDYDGLDSRIEYVLPASGTYYLEVREYSHGFEGGPEYFYTLSLTTGDQDAPWSDDMESGSNGWVADGFWHQVEDGTSPYPEMHSPTHSWWYGQDVTGDYDNGARNAGSLTSPAINIPSSTISASLSLWSWYETETAGTAHDQRWVQISADGSPFHDLAQLSGDPMQDWVEHSLDLSPYVGSQVHVRFYFDTVDTYYNHYRGWYIDDVSINIITSDVGPVISNGLVIDDDNNDDSAGNGDGIADPGETIEMYVELLNTGTLSATGVEVCISEDSPYVDGFLDNVCSDYGDIASGGVALNWDDFEFTIDPSAPPEYGIHFDLIISATNGGPWFDSIDLGGPDEAVGPIIPVNVTVDDDDDGSSIGNGDGIINPGEAIELFVEIGNVGTATAHSVAGCISEDSPYVDLITACTEYGNVPYGDTIVNSDPFAFAVNINTPSGYVIPLCLNVTATNGGPWDSCFDIPVIPSQPGAVLRVEPLDQDVSITGGSFHVDIVVEDVAHLGAFQFDLVYDPAIVTATSVNLGDFLGSTGCTVMEIGATIDNTTGRLTYAAIILGTCTGPSGNGAVATVTFAPLGMGETNLTLDNEQLLNTDNPPAPITPVSLYHGHVTVGDCFFADVDCDGDVDIVDIFNIAFRWGCQCGDPCYIAAYDLNDDCAISISDIQIAACYFGWPNGDFSGCYAPSGGSTDSLSEQIATLRLTPEEIYAQPGESFTVDLIVEDVQDLAGFEALLHYDPRILRFDGLAEGDFLASTGNTAQSRKAQVELDAGTVTLGGFSLGEQDSPEGTGRLVTLTFTIRGAGASTLTLSDVQLAQRCGLVQPKPVSIGTRVVGGQSLYLPTIYK